MRAAIFTILIFFLSSFSFAQNNSFDLAVQKALKWNDTHAAQIMTDTLQWTMIAAPFAATLFTKERFENFKVVGVTTLSNLFVTTVIKHLVGRERPDKSNDLSFPSGHTSSSVAGATMLCDLVTSDALCGVGIGFAFLASEGRVFANRHWQTDVFFGAAIGYAHATYIPKFVFNVNW